MLRGAPAQHSASGEGTSVNLDWHAGYHPWSIHTGLSRGIIAAAAAVVVMHNHPSGEPQLSKADTKVTRDLIRAGQLLKIEVLDHVVMGNPNHCSLRELGYWAGY